MYSAVYLVTGQVVRDQVDGRTEFDVYTVACPNLPRFADIQRQAVCWKVSVNIPVLRRHSQAMCSAVDVVTGQLVRDQVEEPT